MAMSGSHILELYRTEIISKEEATANIIALEELDNSLVVECLREEIINKEQARKFLKTNTVI